MMASVVSLVRSLANQGQFFYCKVSKTVSSSQKSFCCWKEGAAKTCTYFYFLMDYPQDKVKLLLDEPQTNPSLSEEDEDDVDDLDGNSGCRILFVLLIYLAVFGIFFSATTYSNAKDNSIFLDTGRARYHRFKLYERGNVHTAEEWDRFEMKRVNLKRDKAPHRLGGMGFRIVESFNPPPRSEKAKTARFIVHNTIWGSVSTISVSMNGAPFGVVTSFSDGTVDNSTGIPYFYLAAVDPVVQNIKSNPLASLSLTEAESDYCKSHNWDPEEPLCSRVTINGKLVHVDHEELPFAHNALFTRHPVMKTWPKDHDWQTLRLNITHVWLQDNYGPADIIPVEDYFKANL